ncbi:hypothetical protein ACFX5Q_07290 [Mesorhizobium sp. IMUNJ 23033]|uniref:hypothetical protein n=1 Tax=Mesorhizobium sp. IMUNJ 23033 TaxID=3378039 RepID=UPI00384B8793
MVAILIDSAAKKKVVVPAQPGFWRDPRWSGFGVLVSMLILAAVAFAVTSFIAGGGSADKCWNNGGRSDDTYNC